VNRSQSQPAVFRTTRRVEFCHTDAAGQMHFSAFFLFMEQAEHELLRSLGTSVLCHDEEGKLSWPRVEAHCTFHAPARFEDLLHIDVWPEHVGRSSVRYRFRFYKDDQLLAEGTMTSVCCRFGPQGPQAVPVPEPLRSQLLARLPSSPGKDPQG